MPFTWQKWYNGSNMFTTEELEGCPSYQCEEWLNKNEDEIRDIVSYSDQYDRVEELLKLLFKCWNHE